MPRYYSRNVCQPGRNCSSTREARDYASQPGFFSRFSLTRNPNYNYNDIMRRLSSLFEYGHNTDTRPKPTPDSQVLPTYASNHIGVRRPATSDPRLLSLEGRIVREPDPTDVDVLGVESIDFNISQNSTAHHTSEYDITDRELVSEPKLVVRRGQSFDISINFNRAYDKNKDDVKLVFQAGEKPVPSKGTHIEVILSDKDKPKQWGAKIKSQNDKTLNVMVFTPPTCFVAKWNFKLDVLKKKEDKKVIFRYNHKDHIYILFNPWCKDDSVYMEGEAEKNEYVLNETGRIYSGSAGNITHKPWSFGQFQGNVLDCCMYILDESRLSWAVRGNPIPVVRKITASVNDPDDYGVLVGNWSGSYDDGKSPLSWTGSVAILEQYYRSKNPVRYGQCWVFSGVTTTVCRALGIPARSVTNFSSAHDTDGSITIDIHFDEKGELDDTMNDDSVWNFHVWNEAWMARPDLPSGYGGWQACDATPQETSDGVYCCGPVPVLAIKRGEVNLPYDGQFVFAEVNADRVFWTVHEDGSCERVHIQKRGVGRNISTKALMSSEREDVTKNYKFPEGTEEERVAVLKANQTGSCREDIYDVGEMDVNFELTHDENKFVGDNFEVTLKMKNNGKADRTVYGRLVARNMYYTGIPDEIITDREFNISLKPGEGKDEKLAVLMGDYQGKLKDMCMFHLTGMARVKETKQVFTNMNDFRLRKPHLEIKAPKEGRVGGQLTVDISFTNPLQESLTECAIQIDGPGLQEPRTIKQGTVGPRQTFIKSMNFTPKKTGNREIVIIFSSKQLDDINGTYTVNIQSK